MKAPEVLERAAERRALWLLLAVCGALIAGGTALPVAVDKQLMEPAVVRLGPVADAQIVEIRDHAGVTRLSGEFRRRVDSLGNTELDAALTDRQGRRAIGEVEVEVPGPDRGDRQAELEVDVMGLAPLERFTVFIDDRPVGVFTTDDRGSIDRELQEGEATAGGADGLSPR
jgi:hypothetical protein